MIITLALVYKKKESVNKRETQKSVFLVMTLFACINNTVIRIP